MGSKNGVMLRSTLQQRTLRPKAPVFGELSNEKLRAKNIGYNRPSNV